MNITTESVTYEPWTDGRAVGYKITRLRDLAVTYVYLNPSEDIDGSGPDMFLYIGPNGNPAWDSSQHYYVPEFEADES